MMAIISVSFLVLAVIGYVCAPFLVKKTLVAEEWSEAQRMSLKKILEQEIQKSRMKDDDDHVVPEAKK